MAKSPTIKTGVIKPGPKGGDIKINNGGGTGSTGARGIIKNPKK